MHRDISHQYFGGVLPLDRIQNTGFFVERVYKTSFGDISAPTVPVPLRFTDFLHDSQEVGAGLVVLAGQLAG
jgi:hypothetical protein